jgi:hypothetical protein
LLTDVYLLKGVLELRNSLIAKNDRSLNITRQNAERVKTISKDLMVSYVIIWSFLLIDIAIKMLIVAGIPVLFDTIITFATIAMRARCNLQYGLHMRDLFNLYT